jgi:pimeloyl-ACP methyl ester carboxylesterase
MKALVHGVPETAAVWTPLVRALAERGVDDVVTLSPPGFGAPAPDGWVGTPAAYVDWLAAEVVRLDGPVDLLGHDWGSGHVAGLVAARPELVRSWAIDVAGLLHPDYVWHDAAQLWQTPEVGEQVIEATVSRSVADRTAGYVGLGMDEVTAAALAEAIDATMGRCILDLYRGAVQPYMADLGRSLVAGPRLPSLVLNAVEDPYVSAALGAEIASSLGSTLVALEGQSHWWMLSDPGPAADALVEFWQGLDR